AEISGGECFQLLMRLPVAAQQPRAGRADVDAALQRFNRRLPQGWMIGKAQVIVRRKVYPRRQLQRTITSYRFLTFYCSHKVLPATTPRHILCPAGALSGLALPLIAGLH